MRVIEAKKVIGPRNSVNMYRGCSHNCIYCDSRSTVYNIGEFDSIAVKQDFLSKFSQEISKKRNKGVIGTGSMCDPYLHLEKELKLTRGMLEIILQNRFGVKLLTKSDLALRDLDLYKEINKYNKVIFEMTLTTTDDEISKKIERNVTVASKRIECLKKFSDAGIPVGIWFCPILPYITDTVDNVRNIVKAAAYVNAKYIINFGFGVTLREGSRDYLFKNLDLFFPDLKDKYLKRYKNYYECNSDNHIALEKAFIEECNKYGILHGDEAWKYINREEKKVTQISLF